RYFSRVSLPPPFFEHSPGNPQSPPPRDQLEKHGRHTGDFWYDEVFSGSLWQFDKSISRDTCVAFPPTPLLSLSWDRYAITSVCSKVSLCWEVSQHQLNSRPTEIRSALGPGEWTLPVPIRLGAALVQKGLLEDEVSSRRKGVSALRRPWRLGVRLRMREEEKNGNIAPAILFKFCRSTCS
ncbi:hypothetical protein BaRGS_00002563, partial [Batillaria attramentaria]